MKSIIKIALFFIVLLLAQIQFAQILFERGTALCMFRNLPHRGLGMLYVAHTMFPNRADYAKGYLAEYLIIKQDDRLSEPQRVPVIAMYAASIAREFPEDKTIQALYIAARRDVQRQIREASDEAKAGK